MYFTLFFFFKDNETYRRFKYIILFDPELEERGSTSTIVGVKKFLILFIYLFSSVRDDN